MTALDLGRIAYEARFADAGPRDFDPWDNLEPGAKAIWARVEAAVGQSCEATMCEAAALVCDLVAEGADTALHESDPEHAERWQAAKDCAEELAAAIRSLIGSASEETAGA